MALNPTLHAINAALPRVVHSPMTVWNTDTDRFQQFAAEQYTLAANPTNLTSQSSSSTLSCTRFHSSPRSPSIFPSASGSSELASSPSLTSEQTVPESSILTVKTGAIPDRNILVRSNGDVALEQAISATSSPAFPCTFNFLGCHASFEDEVQWKTHCLSHFRLNPPPKSVLCPFCYDFDQTSPDPHVAWEARMRHIALHHRAGNALQFSRPDFHLFRYLWQKGIISHARLQELEGNFYSQREPEAYLVTTHQERRNERGAVRSRR